MYNIEDFGHLPMFSVESDFVEVVTKQINKYKQEVLLLKLEENNIKIDFEAQAKRTFPCIRLITGNREESFYYDNGTEKGLRIVTFKEVEFKGGFGDMIQHKITIEYY